MAGPHTNDLDGQTAVVTGSSTGIGREIAMELAAAGAAIVVHGRRHQDHAEALLATIQRQGGQGQVVLADLADPTEQSQLLERAWRWQGRVSIWVNNAGADVLTGEAAHWSFQDKLDTLWKVDVLATIHLARAAGARMKAAGSGVIVNMGWDGAERGMSGDTGQLFAATKGAVMTFTRSLAQSLAPEVRVNCVAPGWVKTAWGQQASMPWQERAQRESLSGRWGTPEDIAGVVRFLVSPDAGFVSGQIIEVNGGYRFGSFH